MNCNKILTIYMSFNLNVVHINIISIPTKISIIREYSK